MVVVNELNVGLDESRRLLCCGNDETFFILPGGGRGGDVVCADCRGLKYSREDTTGYTRF